MLTRFTSPGSTWAETWAETWAQTRTRAGLSVRRALAVTTIAACIGGCASNKAPDGGADSPRPEAASAPGPGQTVAAGPAAQSTGPDALPAGVVVPVPPIRQGNDVLFARSITLMRDGNLEAAGALLEEITANQPELAGPWINLARVYVSQQRFEDARMALDNALKANPSNCAAHNQMGVLARRFGDFQSAESHYRRCLDSQPRYRDAYLNLGILYELYLGKLPEALDAYRTYQSLNEEPDRRVQGWVVDLQRRVGG